VTNGICLERWVIPELLKYYREKGIIDEFGMPQDGFVGHIERLSSLRLEEIKKTGRLELRETLLQRKDQYDNPVKIPIGSKIFGFRKRFASYKRPEMIYSRPDELSRILADNDIYFIMAGNAHPSDTNMTSLLKRILSTIDANEILKDRVHFIQDYDESLSRAMAHGVDVSINNPQVIGNDGQRISTEACGTSWMKDLINNTMLIFTCDGGLADLEIGDDATLNDSFSALYFIIKGKTYEEEVSSLYFQMCEAARIIDDSHKKTELWKKQLSAFLPIICGSRMIADYLNLAFPKNSK